MPRRIKVPTTHMPGFLKGEAFTANAVKHTDERVVRLGNKPVGGRLVLSEVTAHNLTWLTYLFRREKAQSSGRSC